MSKRKIETRNQLEQRIIEIFASQLGADKKDVSVSTTLDDLGADSLDLVELVMFIEEELTIEISDGEAEKMGVSPREIADKLITWNYIKVLETEHEIKLRTNSEYRARFELTRIPKGRVFTVSLECHDEEASVDLMAAMFSKPVKLIAGCEVLRIDMRDEGKLKEKLKEKIKSVLDFDTNER